MKYKHGCIIWQLGQQPDCAIIIRTRSKITQWQLRGGYPKHFSIAARKTTPLHRQRNKELPSGRKQKRMLSDKLGLQANTEALWHKTARQGYQSKRRYLNHRLTASSPPQPFVPSATTPSQAALQAGRRCLGDPCLLARPPSLPPIPAPPNPLHPPHPPVSPPPPRPPTAYRGPSGASQCQQPPGQHLRPYVTLTLRLSSCPEHLIPALGSQRQPTPPEVRLCCCCLGANPNPPIPPPPHSPPSQSILTPTSSYLLNVPPTQRVTFAPSPPTTEPPPPPTPPLLAPRPLPI